MAGPLITGATFDGTYRYSDTTAQQDQPKLNVTVIPVIPESDDLVLDGTAGPYELLVMAADASWVPAVSLVLRGRERGHGTTHSSFGPLNCMILL